jgi:DNA-binding transcriptional regulator GbsR (MarR family)
MTKATAVATSLASNERVVEDPKAAAFLIDPVSSEHLAPFMLGEKSLAQAASELGISKSRMSYWVKKLLAFDLIRVVRVEKQGKHHASIYRSSADVFTVPLDVMTTDPSKDVFESAPFERTIKRSLVHFKHQALKGRHIRYARENENVVLDVFSQQLTKSETVDQWGRVELTKAQAKLFHQEMNHLFEKIMQASSGKQGEKYLFKLVLVEQWPQ